MAPSHPHVQDVHTPMGAMSHLLGEATEGKWRDSLQLPGGVQCANHWTGSCASVQDEEEGKDAGIRSTLL